jgi:hypothetical protein
MNLLVFLTPHIIYDTNDFKRLVERSSGRRWFRLRSRSGPASS